VEGSVDTSGVRNLISHKLLALGHEDHEPDQGVPSDRLGLDDRRALEASQEYLFAVEPSKVRQLPVLNPQQLEQVKARVEGIRAARAK
jgi:hypothetical protein